MKNALFFFAYLLIVSNKTFAGSGGHCSGHGGHAVITGHIKPALKKHTGEIILASGDTLYGLIKLNEGTLKHAKVAYQKDSISRIQHILYSDINTVKIYEADTALMINKETCFNNIYGDNHLWRILYNGSYTLYDDAMYVNENPGEMGERLFFMDNKNMYKISKWYSSLLAYDDLLRFINKHYEENFRWKDFKSKKKLLNYISQRDAASTANIKGVVIK